MSRKQRFQLGHLYSVDYDDHYRTEREYRETENATPCVLRQRGIAIKESAKMIVLEHNVHMTDEHSTNKRSDRHGIVKSCIIRVQHFGKER